MSFFHKFSRRDFWFSLATGLITGTIVWQLFDYLSVPEFHAVSWAALVVVVPVLWVLGVLLGYLLGQWLEFFNQFGRYVAIGFTNFAVNAAVLNILIIWTGYVRGVGYSVLVSFAFIIAAVSSYFWNKYWSFWSGGRSGRRPSLAATGMEFGKFFTVNIISFLVNVSVASAVVNLVQPLAGLNPHQWANVGIVAGTACALIFNFIGFKMIVFK